MLAAYLTGTDAEDVAAGIAGAIPAACGVGQVASIGRRLAAGEDESTIRKELSEDPARHVRQWLSAEKRPDKEIEEVVALGFAAGQTERIFDVMLDRLDDTLRDVGLVGVRDKDKDKDKDDKEDGGENAGRPQPTGLRRVRAERVRADGLFERKRDTSGGTSRDIMDFEGDEQQRIAYRQHVLEQLWRDFDMTFWRAIRGWLAELIGDTMVTLFRDATVQMSVAAGPGAAGPGGTRRGRRVLPAPLGVGGAGLVGTADRRVHALVDGPGELARPRRPPGRDKLGQQRGPERPVDRRRCPER